MRCDAAALCTLCALLLCGPARADDAVCARDGGMPSGPVQSTLGEDELGLARRACPRSELATGARGLLVADYDAFYGHIRGSGFVWGSWAPTPERELFFTLEAFRYQQVISSVVADAIGVGRLGLGMTQRVASTEDATLGLTGRLVLPTSIGLSRDVWPFALELGVTGLWRAGAFDLHGQLGAIASAALSRGDSDPRAGMVTTAGAAWRALDWLALVLDVHLGLGYAAALDVLALDPGLRFAFGRHAGAELSATLPVAGRERALLGALLRFAWSF
jgi:hypothetical protein